VTSALLYLQVTTVWNALRQRLQRLRQPKYLFGAIAGAAYFYFIVFRNTFRGPHPLTASVLPPDLAPHLVWFGALALFVVIVLAWVLPSSRAALQFTEAEVAFLFPAPVTRRRLIHFKLLRSQVGILVSTFFLTLVFRQARALGGSPWTHAAGWWFILSTLNLHFIGASFAREQLLELGIHPARRRAVVLSIVAGLFLLTWWWIKNHVTAPGTADFSDGSALVRSFGGLLQQPPAGWILAPFALVVRPYFATGYRDFFLAAGPALLVLVFHYWWVMRADVSFEEASLEQARQLAERVAAIRAGDWRGGRRSVKPRPAAFPLRAKGAVVIAFLWKNLTALGPFFRLRTWLGLAAVILCFHLWTAVNGIHPALQVLTGIFPLIAGGWLLLFGPMIMRRDLRLMVTHFDLLKSYPLRGWQVVLGSLLSPLVLLAAVEWLLLFLGAPSVGALGGKASALTAGLLGAGTLGIAVVLPPLAGLMLSIPFAATLYFPAWADFSGPRGGGIEVLGQRLIFFLGYVVVMLTALLPAVLCGGLAAFITHWLAGTVAAVVVAALVAGVVIGAEFAAAVWWLGERFEQFDLSQEMPR
jgi:hypothetical protein